MLLSKQGSHIIVFFNRGRYNNIVIYYFFQNYFDLSKTRIRDNCNEVFLSIQTLRKIKPLFEETAGLDLNLEERKQPCRTAWKLLLKIYEETEWLKCERVDTLLENEVKLPIFNAPLRRIFIVFCF